MDKKAHPDESSDGRLADYLTGCDPDARVTAGIQKTWELHPSKRIKQHMEKGTKRPKDRV